MEKVLQNFFTLSYNILAIPYKIDWEPGLHTYLVHHVKSPFHSFWLARLFLKFSYTLTCWLLFMHLLPKYLVRHQFDLVAFHCEWGLVSLFTLAHQWPHVVASREVKQISSGISGIIKTLQNRKRYCNQFPFCVSFIDYFTWF